ncbi:helix-turn-helix transcriptional regulator [Burkholderia cepacia]|uniref:helix-turn-helix transcriptional regulator n=1 Tax=Burkholderia cepacia TaxID=292 RepID=UPI0026E06C3D|nr:helix-turn-helix transcriptional regulator [Burkholderia cepacia]MDO5948149.1 helix-turn-helix transcriptional regulator [Burkholderia cepacia]
MRKRRESLGLSRRSVSESSGIHLSSIARWETRGLPANVSLAEVRPLERALKVSAAWLLGAEVQSREVEQQMLPGATLQSNLHAAGERARMRREQLGIARSKLAFKIEVRDATLRQWENFGIPHSLGAEKLDAWEKALHVDPGWLLGKALLTTSEPPAVQTTAPARWSTATEVILEVGRIYAKATPRTSDRNASLFAMRYGVNANSRTLATVAKEYGITESRACQILGKMRDHAPKLPRELGDIFDLIEATARQHLPCDSGQLEAVLRPLLGGELSIEDAWRFAHDVFGKVLLSLETHLYDNFVPAPLQDERVVIVQEMARSMISAVGAAHVGVLMGYAIEQGWSIESVRSIREMVQAGQGFEWLDRRERKSPEWFWYGETLRHNPVIVALRRVCAIAEVPIVTDVAMGAVERMREVRLSREERCSTQYPTPPWFVTTAILSRVQFLAGAAGRYQPALHLDPKRELTEQEYRLYSAFRQHGCLTTWEELAEDLVDTGNMSEATLQALLSRSPIVITQSPGVFMLRGSNARAEVSSRMAA